MKLVIRALVIMVIVAVVAALVLTGTIDLQSAFGTSQKEFTEARELLLAEDFGVGIILGGNYDMTISYLGRPSSVDDFGASRSAEYYVPLGIASSQVDSQGKLRISSYDNVITSVTLTLSNLADTSNEGDIEFGGTKLEDLKADDLIDLFGKPAARFVVLNNKVFAWFLLPPIKTEEGIQFNLARTMEVTAKFNKGDGRLHKLSVKVPTQTAR